jgi:hypothetical protein
MLRFELATGVREWAATVLLKHASKPFAFDLSKCAHQTPHNVLDSIAFVVHRLRVSPLGDTHSALESEHRDCNYLQADRSAYELGWEASHRAGYVSSGSSSTSKHRNLSRHCEPLKPVMQKAMTLLPFGLTTTDHAHALILRTHSIERPR